MKRLLVWLGLAIALIGADRAFAGAEQMESKDFKAAPAPIVEPGCKWTGFWIGIHGGYGWGDAGLEEIDDEDSGFRHGQEGFVGGGQAGYNHQVNSWFVIGIEGDLAGSAIDETSEFSDSSEDDDEVVRLHTDIDYIATIGGRLGATFLDNRVFAFFKGGAAFIGFDYTLREFEGGEETDTFHHTADFGTGYVGGGLEYAINCHWSVMGEYKHYFFEGSADITAHIEDSGSIKHFNRERDLDSVLFGVNYKF